MRLSQGEKEEEWLQVLLNEITDGCWVLDEEWRYQFVNEAGARLVNRKPEEIVDRTLMELFPEVEGTPFHEAYRKAMETRTMQRVTAPFAFRDGRTGFYEVNIYPVTGGILCIGRDVTEQKRMEEALEKKSEELRIIFDANPDCTYVTDTEGIILMANRALLELQGLSREQVEGKSIFQFFAGDEPQELEHVAGQLKGGKEVRNLEVQVRIPDGTIRDFEIHAIPLRENGEVVRILSVARDITERKQMEEQVRETEKKVRSLFEFHRGILQHSPVGILKLDSEMRVVYENPKMKELLGIPAGEESKMMGVDIRTLPSLDREILSEMMGEIMKGNEWHMESMFTSEYGKTAHLSVTASPILEEGAFSGAVLMVLDITDQKEMERMLRESEERFRTLVEHAGEGIGIVDEREHFIFANPAADAIFGVSDTGLTGRHLLDFLSPEQRETVLQETEKRKKREKSTYELEITRPDGERRIIVVTATPRFGEQGEYVGAFGVFRDVTEEREMERRVRESEGRFHTFFNATHDLIMVGRLADETIVYVNDAMARSIGKPADELVGVRYADLFPPDVAEQRLARAREVGHTKKPLYFTDERNGRWFDQRLYPIFDEDGEVAYIAGFVRDITEEKKMEHALMVSEERYRSLYSAMNEGVAQFRLVVDDEGVATDYMLVDMNPAYEKLTGMERKRCVGKRGTELFEGDVPPYLETFLQVIRSGKPSVFEMYFQPTQKYFIVSVFPLRNDEFGTVLTDITAHKQLSKQVKESEEKYRTLFECAPEAILLIDQEGTVIDCNEMTAALCKRKREEMMGKPITALGILDEEDVRKMQEHLLSSEDVPRHIPFEIKRAYERGVQWLEIFPALLKKNGDVHAMQLIIRDVTERKQMEEQLSQQEKMAALGTLAAVVAHELNTPLTNIVLTSRLLLSRLGAQYEDDLHTIEEEVEHASTIIKRVLGFSRMGEMEMTRVDIAEIVNRAAESVRNMHIADDVIIQNEVTSPVESMGDRYWLYETFTNLISNAVLARDPHKKVHRVVIDASLSDASLEITVKDNGVGMPKDMVTEAKKPFFTTRAPGEGAGLGLFIADWIVTQHGGSLSIESAVGKGTTVTVHLPLEVK